jgi:hypothetical protein
MQTSEYLHIYQQKRYSLVSTCVDFIKHINTNYSNEKVIFLQKNLCFYFIIILILKYAKSSKKNIRKRNVGLCAKKFLLYMSIKKFKLKLF